MLELILQMTNFMGCHNDTAETAGVLDDGHAVDLLQSLVHDAGASDVCEAFSGICYLVCKKTETEREQIELDVSDSVARVCTTRGRWCWEMGFVNSLGGGKQQINKPTITNNLFAKGGKMHAKKRVN